MLLIALEKYTLSRRELFHACLCGVMVFVGALASVQLEIRAETSAALWLSTGASVVFGVLLLCAAHAIGRALRREEAAWHIYLALRDCSYRENPLTVEIDRSS